MIAYHVKVYDEKGERTIHTSLKDGFSARWWAENLAYQLSQRLDTFWVGVKECKCADVRSTCDRV